MDNSTSFGYEKIKELKQKHLDALKDIRGAKNKLKRMNKMLETAVRKQSFGERGIRHQISLQQESIRGLEREADAVESEVLSDSWRPAVIK